MAKKRVNPAPQGREEANIKSFLDMIAPSVVSFMPDHFICGNTYRCVWALREYPTSTDEQAILRHLGEKDGITLRIYTRAGHARRGKANHPERSQQKPHEQFQHQ